jgi:hypothetical protein
MPDERSNFDEIYTNIFNRRFPSGRFFIAGNEYFSCEQRIIPVSGSYSHSGI